MFDYTKEYTMRRQWEQFEQSYRIFIALLNITQIYITANPHIWIRYGRYMHNNNHKHVCAVHVKKTGWVLFNINLISVFDRIYFYNREYFMGA